MIETTAIIVRTPMMMPNNVRNVLNLFDQRELMAIETDSFRFILAIFGINILHYMIRNRKAKVYGGQVLFFAFTHTHVIYTGRQKARPDPALDSALDNSLLRKQNKRRRDEGFFIREESRSCQQ